jgi:hypothetical protein|tara:strand:- start:4716 stop:4943 length:228 start_codon:yes stop_codon:yes gene_type:complete
MSKVLRVKIHAQELTDCGFDPSAPDMYENVLVPLLRAKNVPEKYLDNDFPVAMEWNGAAIIMEWSDGNQPIAITH